MKPPPVWVFDANVIISEPLNAQGPPGRIIEALLRGDVVLAWDNRILAEYREVLLREKFSFKPGQVAGLLDEFSFHEQVNSKPWKAKVSPDPWETPFLESAHPLDEPVLVIGNTKHFPSDPCTGIRILSSQHARNE